MTRRVLCLLLVPLLTAAAAGCSRQPGGGIQASTSYDDLTALFAEWRAFQQPALVDDVPDYTRTAMAAPTKKSIGKSAERSLEAFLTHIQSGCLR